MRDSDINYMPAVFFSQALILEKIAIPGQPPVPEHWNEGMNGYAKFIDLRD